MNHAPDIEQVSEAGNDLWPRRISICLPTAIPEGKFMTAAFAARAEARGFFGLGTIDRVGFDNLEPLMALAACASVTSKIRLATTVMLAPLRSNTALLAKQLLTLQALSGERVVAGFGVGIRSDDYEISRVDHGRRGRLFDEQLRDLVTLFEASAASAEDSIGPRGLRPPELVIGGSSAAALRRVGEVGSGWMSGRAGLPMFSDTAPKVLEAWHQHGRDGEPNLGALAYFGLGPAARRRSNDYLERYYGFSEDAVRSAQRGAVVDAAGVLQALHDYGSLGCDELYFVPCIADVGQVDLLADAIWPAPSVKGFETPSGV